MADFSGRLKELRSQKGLRQRDLAEQLGLAQTTIANYEQGSRFPDEKTLYALADYFRVSLDYLLGRSGINIVPENLAYRHSFCSGHGEDLEPMSLLARKYLETLLKGDREAASRLVLEAFRRGETIGALYLNVFERSLKEVGVLWAQNKLEVGMEHFFTASTQAIMSQLYPLVMKGSGRRGGPTCLALAVCGEFHEVGARMVADLLEAQGWQSFFLGGNLCNEDVLKAMDEHRPDLLVLSATMYMNVDSAARLIRSVRGGPRFNAVRIMAGGRPFNLDRELWKRVGADGHARNAVDTVAAAEALIRGTQAASAEIG